MGVFYLSHVTFRQTVTNYYVLLKTKYFILKNRISCFAWWTGRSASAGPTFPFGDRQSLCWIDYSGGPLCVPICGKPVLQKGLLTSLTKSPPALLLFSSYFICLFSSLGVPLPLSPLASTKPQLSISEFSNLKFSSSTVPSRLASLQQGWLDRILPPLEATLINISPLSWVRTEPKLCPSTESHCCAPDAAVRAVLTKAWLPVL